jgi:XapX domain-containing protein
MNMTYSKIIWGLLLSFVVGFCCHLAQIPVPSPPVLSGALLVFMMSSGYWLVDRYLAAKDAKAKQAKEKQTEVQA